MNKEQEEMYSATVEKSQKPGRPIAVRLLLYTVFILILVVLGMYGWKVLAVRDLEQKLELQRTEMAQEQQKALEIQARVMLRLTALPFAWAVRTEMMRGDLGRVEDYFGDFVREPGVLSILLIDKENQVVAATNRKYETLPADHVISQSIQDAETVVVEKSESVLRLGVPIMSFNEKIGILVVDYEPQDSQMPKSQQ
jgi:predicted Holliday junction resolvase-like endonuclease